MRFFGYHIIKTCDRCKYWGEILQLPDHIPVEAREQLEHTHRNCEKDESPVMVSPGEYGCIYWR